MLCSLLSCKQSSTFCLLPHACHEPACNTCLQSSANKKSWFTWRAPFIRPHPNNCHWAITPRGQLVNFLLGYYGHQVPGECLLLNLERNDILLEIWEGKCFLPNGALYFCLPSCLHKWVPFQLKPPQFPPWSEFPVPWFLRPILHRLVTLDDWARQTQPANVDISAPLGRTNSFTKGAIISLPTL